MTNICKVLKQEKRKVAIAGGIVIGVVATGLFIYKCIGKFFFYKKALCIGGKNCIYDMHTRLRAKAYAAGGEVPPEEREDYEDYDDDWSDDEDDYE